MSGLPALILCLAASLPVTAQMLGSFHSIYAGAGTDFEAMRSGIPIYDAGLGSFSTPPPSPIPGPQHISADELRHPMTEKARRILLKAWRLAQKGDHPRAIATLQEGMAKVPSFVPYGHGFLGIEYIRTGRHKEAATEFAESTKMFPHDASGHSNLAVSLCLTGDFEAAEREVKLALYLEPTLASANELEKLIEEHKTRHAYSPTTAVKN